MTKTEVQHVKEYIIKKPFVIESFPFGKGVTVFKVKDKVFATLAIGKMGWGSGNQKEHQQDWWMNLKCDPKEAIMLRDIFPAVIPGYHMNKLHWNTVILNSSIPKGEIERMIDNSFDLVVSKMTKKTRASIVIHQ